MKNYLKMMGILGQSLCNTLFSSRFKNLILLKLLLVDITFNHCYVHLMDYGRNGNIQRQRILDMHNMLRSYEAGGAWGKGAVYMLRLNYDTGLESYAKNYATKLCKTGHWGHSKKLPPNRVAPGENLYVNTIDYSSKSPLDFDPSVVVKKWWDERKYFDWNSSNPSAKARKMGQLIGHYTQIVRAEASAVGCWVITGCQCKSGMGCNKENNPPYWSTYMACHYDFGNVGWFPYWPLAFPHRIPRSVRNENRKRCGNCPKGFSVCGTTGGYLNPKRDAYLCVGFWDKNKRLPPSNLLEKSIKARHSKGSLPSWVYMIRHCHNNGGCPVLGAGSKCWEYKDYIKQKKEPKIIFQQCLCNNFKTSEGTWFQRDACLSSSTGGNSQPLTRYGVLPLKDFISSRYNGLRRGKILKKRKGRNSSFPSVKWDATPEIGLKDLSTQQDMQKIAPVFKYDNFSQGDFLESNFSIDDNLKNKFLHDDHILSLNSIQTPEPGIESVLLELKNRNNKKGGATILFDQIASKIMSHEKKLQAEPSRSLSDERAESSTIQILHNPSGNSLENSKLETAHASAGHSLDKSKIEALENSSKNSIDNLAKEQAPPISNFTLLDNSQIWAASQNTTNSRNSTSTDFEPSYNVNVVDLPRPDENVTFLENEGSANIRGSPEDDTSESVIKSNPIVTEDIPKQLEIEQDLTSSEPIINWLGNGDKQNKNNII